MEYVRCGGNLSLADRNSQHFASDVVGFLASQEIEAETLK
jgi:hypothetical protein